MRFRVAHFIPCGSLRFSVPGVNPRLLSFRHLSTSQDVSESARRKKTAGLNSADLKRIAGMLYPHRWILAKGMVSLAISSGIVVAIPRALGLSMDWISLNSDLSIANLAPLGFGLMLLFGLGSITSGTRLYYFSVAEARVIADLRNKAYQSALKQNSFFFDSHQTGDLISRINTDVAALAKAVSGPVLSLGGRALIQGIGCAYMCAKISPTLGGSILAFSPLIGVLGWRYGIAMRKISESIQNALGQATNISEECFGNIRTVKSFAAEEVEAEKFKKQIEDVIQKMENQARTGAIFVMMNQAAGYLALNGVFFGGIYLVQSGVLTAGDLTSFLLYTFFFGVSVASGTNFYSELMKGLGSSGRVFELLDLSPPKTAGEIFPLKGDISFQDIRFSYPDRPDFTVFKSLNLEIQAGTTVAITGNSGSGKTSISKILLKLYDPTSGSITIDGKSIVDVDTDWLRRNIGLVSQEPVLFSGSILENIRYGKPDASMDAVIKSSIDANAHEFIMALPKQYDTLVGERGVSLSGGQKQRVAIARALLKDPRILILDEATSALDVDSESIVQEALARCMQNRTTIVIAHRLSTIQSADKIVVLKDGCVAEEGSHAVLMNNPKGLYRHFVEVQSSS